MKILVGCNSMKGVGGSETYTHALINELIRLEHDVDYFTFKSGITSAKLEDEGVKFFSSMNYDLIIASQHKVVEFMHKNKVTGPIIQVCHGVMTPGELPHEKAQGYISISEEVHNFLSEKGFDSELILNGVDLNRFYPTRKPRKKLKVIASLVQTDEAHQMVVQAAEEIGNIEVIRLNKYQDKVWEVEEQINKADLVVSLGRGCFEAMACGRPVVIFDKRNYQDMKGDGYLHPDKFMEFVKNNCSGRYSNLAMSVEDLKSALLEYNQEDGAALFEIASSKLNIVYQTTILLNYAQQFINGYSYPGNTDVVYVLGRASQWADNEIRYSIRSFKKHFKDVRNIVVVGQRPPWMRGVIHIPFADNLNINKDARMIQKIAAACKDSRVSDRFIFCTDDTFLNADLRFEDFIGWHDGPIMYNAEEDLKDHRGSASEGVTPSSWFDWVYNTGEELKRRNLPDNNYDRSHCPQPIDSEEFLSVIKEWDFVKNRYTCSNLYLNSSSIFKGENISGYNGKVYTKMTSEELSNYLDDKLVWNINDNGLNEEVQDKLQQLYPEPSEYEVFISGSNRREMARNWFSNHLNDDSSDGVSIYDEGLAIIATAAPRNRRLIAFLENKRGTKAGLMKIKNTLRLWLR